ncbi:hypothetical protein CSOJ01_05913 [Colletotrichum sojae]|uniref:Uncharacterized protein n=1 Tax=Colletotrichum sojae TaxID=2175907 RepID=A0A8H6JDW1_9PEZI|nr:hypothetical protein CSOJ01_05913 [Colletotrichum sojae]
MIGDSWNNGYHRFAFTMAGAYIGFAIESYAKLLPVVTKLDAHIGDNPDNVKDAPSHDGDDLAIKEQIKMGGEATGRLDYFVRRNRTSNGDRNQLKFQSVRVSNTDDARLIRKTPRFMERV